MADPISAGLSAAGTAAGAGAEQALGGLSRLLFSGAPHPEDVGRGLLTEIASGLAGKGVALKDVVMGALGVMGSPAAGVGAATTEAVKGYAPELDAVQVPGGAGGVAPFLRSASGDPLPSTLPMPMSELAGIAAGAMMPGPRGSRRGYHVTSPEAVASIREGGLFNRHGGPTKTYFTGSLASAKKWGEVLVPEGPYAIVEFDLPSGVPTLLDKTSRPDFGLPGRYIEQGVSADRIRGVRVFNRDGTPVYEP